MSLIVDNVNNIKFDKNDHVNRSILNTKIHTLIENDKSLVYSSKMEPRIWECTWWLDENLPGYTEGDCFWYNTQDPAQFLLNKADDIYNYVKNDNDFRDWIKPFESSDPTSFDTYYNIMTGYVDVERGIKRKPLFDIGNIANKTQIKISLTDNNKFPLSDSQHWKNYFVELSDITDSIHTIFDKDISSHVENYHFSGKSVDLSQYALKDFSNVTKFQKLGSHACDMHKDSREGLDFVKDSRFHQTSDIQTITQLSTYTALSSHSYLSVIDSNVPGKYILNNSVSFNEIRSKFENTLNYQSVAQIITTIQPGQTIGNIELKLSGSNDIDFPFKFKYTPEYYEQISGLINQYYISFIIADLSCSTLDGISLSNYYSFVPDYPLSASDYSEVSGFEDKYQVVQLQKTIELTSTQNIQYNIISGWTQYWNSGYLDQGGIVILPKVVDPIILNIKLQIPYEYTPSKNSYYGAYDRLTPTLMYSPNNNLKRERRYTISISPVVNSFDHIDRVEIVKIENDGFSILVTDKSPNYISFKTSGIISY